MRSKSDVSDKYKAEAIKVFRHRGLAREWSLPFGHGLTGLSSSADLHSMSKGCRMVPYTNPRLPSVRQLLSLSEVPLHSNAIDLRVVLVSWCCS